MKKLSLIIALIITSVAASIAQGDNRNFGKILQTYYIVKDKDLIEKTIDFANNSQMAYSRLEPLLVGFYGALYLEDQMVKEKMNASLDKIQNAEIKRLLTTIATLNIDSIYLKTSISPSYNDMNWSSFFATGKTKYLDRIIANIPHNDNREDLNLFLAGASAKWSLCSNATQDALVKQHLISLQEKNKAVAEILSKDQQYYREEMISILKAQKAKGIWN